MEPTRPDRKHTELRIRPVPAAVTLLTAVAAGLLVWGIVTPLGGLVLQVPAAGQTVGPVSITLAAPVLSGASGAVLAVLDVMHVLVGAVLILGLRNSTVMDRQVGRTVAMEVP